MPGPLEDPNARRRNAPTIPTTNLPAGGRKGRPPTSPYPLGKAGSAWWKWAWTTPQASAWSKGDLYVVARRAQLEDDLDHLASPRAGLDLRDLRAVLHEDGAGEVVDLVELVIGKLQALAANKLPLVKECRELDDRLGLTPKAMAALRWKIIPDEIGERRAERAAATRPARRLSAVDPSAVAGG